MFWSFPKNLLPYFFKSVLVNPFVPNPPSEHLLMFLGEEKQCIGNKWVNKKLTKVSVESFLPEFVALKRTAHFKQRRALILIGCFSNTTRTLLWEKRLGTSIFVKHFILGVAYKTSFLHISRFMEDAILVQR